jgi:hopene-associated glycosyltransferase HpnB
MLGLVGLSLVIWIGLVTLRDGFWRPDQQLPEVGHYFQDHPAPSVAIVIPARNEGEMLPHSLRSLLSQDYPGEVTIVLVNDQSSDNTAQVAHKLFETAGDHPCRICRMIDGAPLPSGWTGKLWALDQGIGIAGEVDYLLLTDADISHSPDNLSKLVHQAITTDRDLVSLMVKLRVQSGWERWLIPAFVFFFMKLYPFRAVNNPARSIGAAAGGCSLIRRSALEALGGIGTIRGALIDDCILGQAIKASGNGRIWLGLTGETVSVRPYDSLAAIWSMVARSAYAQLNYSPLLLLGTILGLALVYGIPIVGCGYGLWLQDWRRVGMGALTYGLMTMTYLPMVRFYQQPAWMSLGLPGVAVLYGLMTLDSARKSFQGQGSAWKGRVYPRNPNRSPLNRSK